MTGVDFDRFDALTFDCYGTLVDWGTGITTAVGAVLERHGVEARRAEVLDAYGQAETEAEAGPYLRYRDVVGRAMLAACRRFDVEPTAAEVAAFGDSVGDWPPFPDSTAALRRLAGRFRLGVITNCDDDLFARTNERLGVRFDWIVTAQQVGSYKPNENNFLRAFERIEVPRERILHVAQSLYHDHVPAKRLGMTSIWVDRDQGGGGVAQPGVDAHPDLTVPDMATLAGLALGASGSVVG